MRFNYLIQPRAEPSPEEIRALFIPYLENAFVKSRYLPELAEEFLKKVQGGEITGFVPICAAWRRIYAAAMEEHEKYREESFFGYLKRKLTKKARIKSGSISKRFNIGNGG